MQCYYIVLTHAAIGTIRGNLTK